MFFLKHVAQRKYLFKNTYFPCKHFYIFVILRVVLSIVICLCPTEIFVTSYDTKTHAMDAIFVCTT